VGGGVFVAGKGVNVDINVGASTGIEFESDGWNGVGEGRMSGFCVIIAKVGGPAGLGFERLQARGTIKKMINASR